MPGGPRLKQVRGYFANRQRLWRVCQRVWAVLKNDALYADKARQVSELAVI